MFSTVLAIHEGLGDSRRLPAVSGARGRISAAELGVLLMLGVAAAALSVLVKLKLGIPGHNIIRVVLPMVLGLAIVPRRGAASVMGAGGVAAASLFALGGVHGVDAGAFTSLALTGLLLDAALLGARTGWSIYVRLALAGVAANMVAFLVRGGEKFLFGAAMHGAPLAFWWPKAIVTYPVCGLAAGLISAAVAFRLASGGDTLSDDAGAA